jgi:hypothetical protein
MVKQQFRWGITPLRLQGRKSQKMKKIVEKTFSLVRPSSVRLVLLIVSVCVLSTATAANTTAPSVGLPVKSTVDLNQTAEDAVVRHGHAAKFLESGAVVTVTPILLAERPSGSWTAGADEAIDDALAGQLTNLVSSVPGSYQLANHKIDWYNLVYSTSSSMWDGVINPPAPNTNEFGHTVWFIVEAQSASGNDDLSLDMLKTDFASSDGGVLNGSQVFTNEAYTPRAIAIQSGGKVISSGSTSVPGKRIIILVRSKLFNGGGTQGGLDQVKNWVADQGNYSLSCTATVGNNSSTATVSIGGLAPATPRFVLDRLGSMRATNGVSGVSYRLYSMISLNQTNGWQLAGIMNGTNAFTVSIGAGQMFFKLVPQ